MSAAARRPSIAQAILLLVIATVAAATAINFAITFGGPPPKDPPRGVRTVAQALRTGRQPGGAATGGQPPLSIYTSPAAPGPGGPERADPDAVARLARVLGVPPAALVGYTFGRPAGIPDAFIGGFTFGLRIAPGEWRVVASRPGPPFTSWHLATLWSMLATLALLSLIGWRVARAIARPLRDLAGAAAQAQAGADRPPFPTGGPAEVRALTGAVSAMHDRLSRHAEGRTAMLAAITHDLGTPLSRLAFWVEQLPDAARDRAAADIAEMRDMLGEVLRFARDERVAARARLDLGSVLDSLVDDLAAAGRPVTLAAGPRALILGDPAALRRLFQNLIENAIRYGERAAVGWTLDARGAAVVTVDDAGPGFDPALAARAFEPFVRGEPSRNRATGGSGLGLAIVRALTEAHGGAVVLGAGPDGGRVTVTLPTLAAAG